MENKTAQLAVVGAPHSFTGPDREDMNADVLLQRTESWNGTPIRQGIIYVNGNWLRAASFTGKYGTTATSMSTACAALRIVASLLGLALETSPRSEG